MIVMKFGGSSVADAQAIRTVSAIVRQNLQRRPLVVASACAGVTNALLALADAALGGGGRKSLEQVEALRLRHRTIADELFTGDLHLTIQAQIDALMAQLRDLAKSIAILGELTDRSKDTFAAFGEKLSTLLLYHQMKQEGLNAVLLNAQEVIITTADFTRALPLFSEVEKKAHELVRPMVEAGQVVITQGFIGATRDGITTTIGRGGSDYSAAIFGSALDAEVIQIWTDVDGMMTSDPSAIKDAHLIPEITFREAAELAYFGAKVLHPATILPAVQKNIPVEIRNSRRPGARGTVIVRERTVPDPQIVTSIACKKGITLISIESSRMLMMHGFLARVFEIFARFQKSVDVIATSEVSISLTIDSDADLDSLCLELQSIATVEVARNKAIFCVVGENMKKVRGTVARIFSTLDAQQIPVSMISLGASEINVTFVVDGEDVQRSAEILHAAFFPAG